ncbi:unknown [Sinorhizobium phage PBC5]|nr:unknown [Sinorhizobium phage PBC5]
MRSGVRSTMAFVLPVKADLLHERVEAGRLLPGVEEMEDGSVERQISVRHASVHTTPLFKAGFGAEFWLPDKALEYPVPRLDRVPAILEPLWQLVPAAAANDVPRVRKLLARCRPPARRIDAGNAISHWAPSTWRGREPIRPVSARCSRCRQLRRSPCRSRACRRRCHSAR